MKCYLAFCELFPDGVAPRTGCVDWNSVLRAALFCPSWLHPGRGAWIEILDAAIIFVPGPSRTPHGVRGLKF